MSLFINALIVILFVVVVGIVVNITMNKSYTAKMSIKEAIDLTGMPIVTFVNNGNKYNFVVDTGSNLTFVSSQAAESMNINYDDTEIDIIGNASKSTGVTGTCTIEYDNILYNMDVIISEPLTYSFEETKKIHGVQLHGLLGGDFLQNTKGVIDYNKLIISFS